MKKLFFLTTLLSAALIFSACGAATVSTASPTEVFKRQSEAQKKKDAASMKQNLSKNTLKIIEDGAKTQNKTVDQMLTEDTPMTANAPDTFETRNEKIEGDNASIEVKDPRSEQWATIPFVKEDGQWKIALDKFMQDLMKKAMEEQKQSNGNNPAH